MYKGLLKSLTLHRDDEIAIWKIKIQWIANIYIDQCVRGEGGGGEKSGRKQMGAMWNHVSFFLNFLFLNSKGIKNMSTAVN
jgi:hypothetical protein